MKPSLFLLCILLSSASALVRPPAPLSSCPPTCFFCLRIHHSPLLPAQSPPCACLPYQSPSCLPVPLSTRSTRLFCLSICLLHQFRCICSPSAYLPAMPTHIPAPSTSLPACLFFLLICPHISCPDIQFRNFRRNILIIVNMLLHQCCATQIALAVQLDLAAQIRRPLYDPLK